ncbi:hypothetical protein K0M31_015571 [Melipona bicolor]|uniref:Uncharacterized protein n=1 Tax=Melipona bicolor TaxID=60889 RepID=A0AA40KEY4_9HYME|nr:hypothetical protein K0M31_015571 [Melipona bicolor]
MNDIKSNKENSFQQIKQKRKKKELYLRLLPSAINVKNLSQLSTFYTTAQTLSGREDSIFVLTFQNHLKRTFHGRNSGRNSRRNSEKRSRKAATFPQTKSCFFVRWDVSPGNSESNESSCPRRRGNDSAVGDVIVPVPIPVPARDKLLFPGDKVLKTLSIVLDKEEEGIQTGPITFSLPFFPPKVATGQKHDDNLLESPRFVAKEARLVRYVFARGVSRNVGLPPSYLIRLVIAAESCDDEPTRGIPLARSLP